MTESSILFALDGLSEEEKAALLPIIRDAAELLRRKK